MPLVWMQHIVLPEEATLPFYEAATRSECIRSASMEAVTASENAAVSRTLTQEPHEHQGRMPAPGLKHARRNGSADSIL